MNIGVGFDADHDAVVCIVLHLKKLECSDIFFFFTSW